MGNNLQSRLRYFLANLRVRLLLLVLLAIIPILGLMLYTNLELRRIIVADVREGALRLARVAAGDQADSIRDTRQLLFALSQLPQIHSSDPEVCSAFFAQLLRQYPQYSLMGVISPDGRIFCSAYPSSDPNNVSDQPFFQQVLQTKDFTISDYQINQTTNQAMLTFGYPVLDEARQIRAVVFATLDLSWLNRLAAEAQLPGGSTFTAIDRNGTILVRYPDPELWVGQRLPESPIVDLVLATKGEGTAEAEGIDGVPRLFAFTPLFGVLNSGEVYVNVGIPTEVAFADANRVLTRNLVGLGLVSLLAVAAVWFGGQWFIVRWVNVLVGATRRLSTGDLTTRTGLPYGKGELSQLALAFDEMANSLERHVAERNEAENALRETQRRLSTLLSNLPGMAYRCQNNRARTMEFVSEGCHDLTGYSPTELMANQAVAYGHLIHADDRDKVWHKMQAALKARRPFQLTYRLVTRSGQEKWIWEQGRGVFSKNRYLQALEGFVTDATDRVQAYQTLEQRVADRTRALSALYDVTAVASESLDLETILNRSLDQVLQVMGVEVGTIHLFDEANEELYLAAYRGVHGANHNNDSLLPSDHLIEQVFERGEPLVWPSPTDSSSAPTIPKKFSQPYIGVPMQARGKVLGVLSVFGKPDQLFSSEEVTLLDSIADQVSVAVENGLLYRQAEQLAVMEERSRLARELHDSVTQSLYSLTLFAEVGRRAAEGGQLEQTTDYLTRVGQVAQQTLKEMRLLVYELRTTTLETEGLVGALQQRLDAVEKRAGVEARLVVEEMTELPALVEEGLYRIAQEALNNALKHSGATVVTVLINGNEAQVELEVIDNGRAFDPGRVGDSGGMGLITMRERAERLDGSFRIIPEPGRGTRVWVSMPTRRSWSRPVLPIDKLTEVS